MHVWEVRKCAVFKRLEDEEKRSKKENEETFI